MNIARTLPLTLLLIAFTSVVEAGPVLFAIHDAFQPNPNAADLVLLQVAEDLPYGPAATRLLETDPAFFDTSLGTQLHNQWLQRGIDDSGTLYEIAWQFSDTKTIATRLQNAIDVGEPVQWTVRSPLITGAQSFSGTWRFSSGAGDLSSKFDGSSGTEFVSDLGPMTPGNGIWGAGNGVIDGTTAITFPPVFPPKTNLLWGVGNLDGNDFFSAFANSGTLILNGEVQTSLPPGFKNLMYVQTTAVPEPSSFLFLGLPLLITAGVRRYRKRLTSAAR